MSFAIISFSTRQFSQHLIHKIISIFDEINFNNISNVCCDIKSTNSKETACPKTVFYISIPKEKSCYNSISKFCFRLPDWRDLSTVASPKQAPILATSYPPKKFIGYYKYLETNPDLVKEQYALLKDRSTEALENLKIHFAKLPENRRKNRYTNISPCKFNNDDIFIEHRSGLIRHSSICRFKNVSPLKEMLQIYSGIRPSFPLTLICPYFIRLIALN